MNIELLWDDLDDSLQRLMRHGYCHFPSIAGLDLGDWSRSIIDEMEGTPFKEQGVSHLSFLKLLQLDRCLVPRLYELAVENFGYRGGIGNQYHIARHVAPGNSKEAFRAHFDSHLFTMVLPMQIPIAPLGEIGDLLYVPKARRFPRSEVENVLLKLWFKRFASEEGMRLLRSSKCIHSCDFQDYRPFLFLGKTTLHANKFVSSQCSAGRLTLLAHFFDPSPRYSVGGALRTLRAR